MSGSIQQALAHASIKVAEDGDRFKFNTGVAALMILVNELEDSRAVQKITLKHLIIMLAPFAPHLAEDLWEKIGGEGSVHQQPWPVFSESVASENEVVVQVNGKRRGSLSLAAETPEDVAVAEALKLPAVTTALSGKEPKRVVFVPGKIVNFVV